MGRGERGSEQALTTPYPVRKIRRKRPPQEKGQRRYFVESVYGAAIDKYPRQKFPLSEQTTFTDPSKIATKARRLVGYKEKKGLSRKERWNIPNGGYDSRAHVKTSVKFSIVEEVAVLASDGSLVWERSQVMSHDYRLQRSIVFSDWDQGQPVGKLNKIAEELNTNPCGIHVHKEVDSEGMIVIRVVDRHLKKDHMNPYGLSSITALMEWDFKNLRRRKAHTLVCDEEIKTFTFDPLTEAEEADSCYKQELVNADLANQKNIKQQLAETRRAQQEREVAQKEQAKADKQEELDRLQKEKEEKEKADENSRRLRAAEEVVSSIDEGGVEEIVEKLQAEKQEEEEVEAQKTRHERIDRVSRTFGNISPQAQQEREAAQKEQAKADKQEELDRLQKEKEEKEKEKEKEKVKGTSRRPRAAKEAVTGADEGGVEEIVEKRQAQKQEDEEIEAQKTRHERIEKAPRVFGDISKL